MNVVNQIGSVLSNLNVSVDQFQDKVRILEEFLQNARHTLEQIKGGYLEIGLSTSVNQRIIISLLAAILLGIFLALLSLLLKGRYLSPLIIVGAVIVFAIVVYVILS